MQLAVRQGPTGRTLRRCSDRMRACIRDVVKAAVGVHWVVCGVLCRVTVREVVVDALVPAKRRLGADACPVLV